MTWKAVVRGMLLSFVVASLGFTVLKEAGLAGAANLRQEGKDRTAAPEVRDGVIAYYFHGTKRCNTCRTIERLSREAIESGFPEALMSSALDVREVNTDEPAHQHFIEDFDLVGSTLVLVEVREGRTVRHRVLDEVWNLVADSEALIAYVQDETRRFLEAAR